MSSPGPIPINPDCRDGKHPACNEDAWDELHDCRAVCCCLCHEGVDVA